MDYLIGLGFALLMIVFIFLFGFLVGIEKGLKLRNKKKIKNPCTCSNPQWCDINCHAKELFYEDSRNGLV